MSRILAATRISAKQNYRIYPRLATHFQQKQFFSTEKAKINDKNDAARETFLNAKCAIPHFTQSPHPLLPKQDGTAELWVNPNYNHVWSEEELQSAQEKQPHHKPKGVGDKLMYAMVRTAYHFFNFLTGYSRENPKAESLVWRLIVLESLAGCPGMVAASVRHLRSLRHLERDHGWIHTLLNEAENERMHLLVVMNQFKASRMIKAFVFSIQMTMVPFMTILYLIQPRLLHRMVGYLEETAVYTYSDIIDKMQTPGTHLHEQWMPLMAPNIAKTYWRMPDNATWLDVMKQVCADEANHRDVNHTFASMKVDDPNPWVQMHHEDAKKAWQFMDNMEFREEKSYLRKSSQSN